MAQWRQMVGGALAALLLIVFAVGARCEVLCSLPSVTSCECPASSQNSSAMPGMASASGMHGASAAMAGVRGQLAGAGMLTNASCHHSVTVPDAEAIAQASPLSLIQVGKAGSPLPSDQATNDLPVGVDTMPPLLRMTPLVQTSALRI